MHRMCVSVCVYAYESLVTAWVAQIIFVYNLRGVCMYLCMYLCMHLCTYLCMHTLIFRFTQCINISSNNTFTFILYKLWFCVSQEPFPEVSVGRVPVCS